MCRLRKSSLDTRSKRFGAVYDVHHRRRTDTAHNGNTRDGTIEIRYFSVEMCRLSKTVNVTTRSFPPSRRLETELNATLNYSRNDDMIRRVTPEPCPGPKTPCNRSVDRSPCKMRADVPRNCLLFFAMKFKPPTFRTTNDGRGGGRKRVKN